jgi:hypothetical protein
LHPFADSLSPDCSSLQLEYDRRNASGDLPGEAYFARKQFDPAFMRDLGPWSPPLPLGQ